MTSVLETERRTFEQARADLLRTDHGKYVLVRGTRVLGIHETEADALRAGYRALGDAAPFLVRRVEGVEEEVPATLGVLALHAPTTPGFPAA